MNKAKSLVTSKNITKQIKAGFMQNRQKGQNITKPTEAESLIEFPKSQNKTYLENRTTKRISYKKCNLKNSVFTN